jgi:flagellar basal-body rod modification protein FlgD
MTTTTSATTAPVTTTAATTANGTTSTPDAMAQLSGNFSTFLTLLTTQLKNQDPTSPMDSNQFTQQLVEFSQVEQQINTNTNLQTLISQGTAQSAAYATGYLGKTVTVADGRRSQLELQSGSRLQQHRSDRDQCQRQRGLHRRRRDHRGQQHLQLERPGQ